jgi:formamidopyrimidine-DNA glycosylase
MPEVFDVKKYADFLKKKCKNELIHEINILNGRYKKHGPFSLYNEIVKSLPLKVIDIKTKGKFLYILFEKDFILFSTLGLSGGWTYKSNKKDNFEFPLSVDYIGDYNVEKYKKNALKHLNVEFKLDTGSIYYFDTLSFGTMKIVDNYDELNKKLKSLAHNIMDEDTTFEIFKEQIMKIKNMEKMIGIVLMNQKVISGIGNYLRSDILWLSHISPFRKIKDITENDLKMIYKNSILLTWGEYDFNKAYSMKLINKKDKLPKDYNRNFFVYKQTEDIHGNKVIKEELYEGSQKRSIYWVKEVQK